MYALIDCNNFFASCERVWRPDLQNKPIVVLSNNDGCVIARSNEAKALGIAMAEPFFKIRAFCKQHDIFVFSSNYTLYKDMSARVMRLIQKAWPEIEIYSIDEAFLDLSTLPQPQQFAFCEALQQKILQYTGIPTSIGLGSTKTLAKVSNFIAKKLLKTPVFALDNADFWLAQLNVRDVWGIGQQWQKKLYTLGIKTALDLKNWDNRLARLHCNVVLERTILELNGMVCLGLEKPKPKQSILSSASFGQLQGDYQAIREAVSQHCRTAWAKMRKQGLVAQHLSVFVQSNSFRPDLKQHAGSVGTRLIHSSDDIRKLSQYAEICLKQAYRPGIYYRKCGVLLSDLIPRQYQQMDLLSASDATLREKADKVMHVIETINHKYGPHTLHLAAEGFQKPWSMARQYRSPCYTTRWSEIPLVYTGPGAVY